MSHATFCRRAAIMDANKQRRNNFALGHQARNGRVGGSKSRGGQDSKSEVELFTSHVLTAEWTRTPSILYPVRTQSLHYSGAWRGMDVIESLLEISTFKCPVKVSYKNKCFQAFLCERLLPIGHCHLHSRRPINKIKPGNRFATRRPCFTYLSPSICLQSVACYSRPPVLSERRPSWPAMAFHLHCHMMPTAPNTALGGLI